MAFSLVDTLHLRCHEHTFVAFIDIKKVFDSCWVETALVRLFDFGVMGSLWHLLANFLCGALSQVRLGGSVSLVCPSPPQLHADDLVVLTASQIDLQLALDAVHAWGVRWRFSFGVGSPRWRSLALIAVQIFGRCPLPHSLLAPSRRGDRLFHQAIAWCLGRSPSLLHVFRFRYTCSLKLLFWS